MGLSGISKSQVSKLCKEIDERVHAFLDRPLAGEWPYLWLDATYLKQREGGRIVSVAAIIAVAANTDGRREIVGLHIGPSEAETFWSTFLKSLARRGLRGVKLVISDAHEGLKAAIRRVFGAGWQRCRVHWMRNALDYVPKTQQSMVAAALRQAFLQPDRAQASAMLRHVADQLRPKWPKLAAFIDDSETDVLSYLDFPEQHRSKLHSTNPLERLNKEVKRRADVQDGARPIITQNLAGTCWQPHPHRDFAVGNGEEIEKREVVKGYEYSRGQFLTFTAEELMRKRWRRGGAHCARCGRRATGGTLSSVDVEPVVMA